MVGQAWASTIVFDFTRINGAKLNRPFTVKSASNASVVGTNVVYGAALTVTPTNGHASVTLATGNYLAILDGFGVPLPFYAPDGTNSFRFENVQTALPMVVTGTNMLFFTNGNYIQTGQAQVSLGAPGYESFQLYGDNPTTRLLMGDVNANGHSTVLDIDDSMQRFNFGGGNVFVQDGYLKVPGGLIGPVNGTNVSGVGKVINVKDAPFNAKGDGVTDDSAAVQAALWYAAATNTAPDGVYMPLGDYLFKTHVQLPPNTAFYNNANNTGQSAGKNYRLFGDGYGTRILWTNNTGEPFYCYVDQTVTTWTNWVNYIKLEKFSIVGPWLGNPDRTNFSSGADGSAITAAGIRVGPTGALPSYPAVGNFWKFNGLKINGFANGIVATNINWPTIEDCTIEYNTKNSILLAGTISPVIRRCGLGTLINTTWTNDVAAVSLENDAMGNIGNGTAIISDCLSGYNSLFVFCTNGRPLTVRDCGQEVSFRGFAELNANGSRASFDGIDYYGSATALGFIIAYNRSIDGSKPGDDMSGWRIGNVWNWINLPLIYGGAFTPTWTHLPRISIPDGNAAAFGYYQSDNSLTTIPPERMGLFQGSYVYLPSVGEVTEARIIARMGQEVGYGAIAGNLTRNIGQTTLGTMGGFNGYGWFQITGTPATPAIGAIHYALPKNQSSSTYNLILSALSTNTGQFAFWGGVQTYTNGTTVTEQSNVGDTVLTAGQVKGFNKFVKNARPSWGQDGQTFYIYYYDVTNTVWLIDVQVESVIPYTSPTTNQGWRLPSRS